MTPTSVTKARPAGWATPTPAVAVLPSLTDGELAHRAACGAVGAFEELVRRHEASVLAFLQRRVLPGVEPEDVAQESFLRAWEAMDRFDPTRPFRPWILTIASREAISHNRRRRSYQRAIDNLATDSDPDGGIAGPSESNDASKLQGTLWQLARECLSPDAQAALWLRYAEGMAPKDIAVVLGRPALHVRVMLTRATQRLQKLYQSRYGEARPDVSFEGSSVHA